MTPSSPLARIALLGSPNAGKTTLFNALTGLRGKTGNYPGVTVDRREGLARAPEGEVLLCDLPGTYSLHPMAEDERLAVGLLRGNLPGTPQPDGVVLVADATTLERSLPFIAEVLQEGLPTFLVLTMVDELKARGGELDLFALKKTLNIPVVGIVGNRGIGLDDVLALLATPQDWPRAENLPGAGTEARFSWADLVLKEATRASLGENRLTKGLDAILLHPLWGGLVFLAFVTAFFQAIFSWAAPAMDLLDGWCGLAADSVAAQLPPGALTSLLTDGIIRGVGAVLVFLPQIALLFALIFFFEACGYMARAAFVMDRIMGWVGLEGRCFMALLSSFACAVPGILATRAIPSRKQRLITILVAPFMTCSARLPVYALLIGAIIPATAVAGPITLQGLTLMGLYVLGVVGALLSAAVLHRGLRRGAALPFYLELPPYRIPSLASVLKQVWRRVLMFLRRAGTIILAASILIWALLHFPEVESSPEASPAQAMQAQIEGSYAADFGRAIEPALAPMDWDWRIGIGLVGSFAAREVLVSTLAQVYAEPSTAEGNYRGLRQSLTTPHPLTGRVPLHFASALALMVFFVFALQCVSTLVAIARETGSWRWAALALVWQTGMAWVAAWLTYLILV